jgi:hypothetical protein
MEQETVGKLSTDLLQKISENSHSADEQMREQLSDWDKNMFECIERGRNKYSKDFYVEVNTKKERLMPNVLRNYFMDKLACPTPTYDQTVYKFHFSTDTLQFLWVIPAQDVCKHLFDNVGEIPESEHDLLRFVFQFYDGTLLRTAKKLNGEKDDSPFLEI